ncbi:MAG: hypothetical protein D6675_11480 [Gemmatimonadetes bacterium]|nr:MAG: hypothetical protein D6675_11480 [Gemmatimonadota bacterium]
MLTTTIAALLTLGAMSLVWKENIVSRFIEHLILGISLGYGVVLTYRQIFLRLFWVPVTTDFAANWILILPTLIGALWLAQPFQKVRWLSLIPLAMVLGAFSGLGLERIMSSYIIEALEGTVKSLYVAGDLQKSFDHVVIWLGVVCILSYFYFRRIHNPALEKAHEYTRIVGIWWLMASFGVSFGFTVMARAALLIYRIQFLTQDWIGELIKIASGGGM